MRLCYLNKLELATLFLQNPKTKSKGGFQSLLVKLQNQANATTGLVVLFARDVERIYRYSYKYNQGGWQDMLMNIFGRVMPMLKLLK